MKPTKKMFYLILILCLFIGPFEIVCATTESFNVEARKELVCKINVASHDKVQLTFITTGQASSNLSFSIMSPNSTEINFGESDQYSTIRTSNVQGKYEWYIDNTNSSEVSLFPLNYNFEHYIFGMSEMIFALVAIAVLLMVIVSGYLITGKNSF